MATTKRGGGRASRSAGEGERTGTFGLGLVNGLLLLGALVAIVAGYVLLDRGSITDAPILLVIGYVVLIPVALLVGSGGEPE